jgi:hypothetical protein
MIINIWIVLNSLLYIGIGILTFIKPQTVADTVGYVLSRPGAFAELKACYGGLMIVIGSLMLYLMRTDSAKGLLFLTVIYLGFGLGRFVGILTNQAYDHTTLIYISFETFATIFSYVLYLRYFKM